MKRAQFLNLPNAITAYRIVAGPVCMWLLTAKSAPAMWIALALVVSAELSDLIDGYVARSSSQVSNFGKILDPMADCLYRGSVFIAFVINGWMAVWMLSIIVWRDLTVSYLREIAELRSETLGARASGKWKAIVQGGAQIIIVGMAAIFDKAQFALIAPVVQALLIVATAVTAYSLVDYASGVVQRTWRLR
jgi:CDP-diacylglycerol--glycerol-3-phosphate 3-phosphatidyltransferase